MGTRGVPLLYVCKACGANRETRETHHSGMYCDKKCRADADRKGRSAPTRYMQGGYWMLRWTVPGGTKRRPNRKFQLEHRAVWEQHNGPIPDGWVVHHINGDKIDNRIENLHAMVRSEHGHEHRGFSVGQAELSRRWHANHPEYKAKHALNERNRRAKRKASKQAGPVQQAGKQHNMFG